MKQEEEKQFEEPRHAEDPGHPADYRGGAGPGGVPAASHRERSAGRDKEQAGDAGVHDPADRGQVVPGGDADWGGGVSQLEERDQGQVRPGRHQRGR